MDLGLNHALWAVAVIVPPIVILSGRSGDPAIKAKETSAVRANLPGDPLADAPSWRGELPERRSRPDRSP